VSARFIMSKPGYLRVRADVGLEGKRNAAVVVVGFRAIERGGSIARLQS
jgi:hypothetical protein